MTANIGELTQGASKYWPVAIVFLGLTLVYLTEIPTRFGFSPPARGSLDSGIINRS